MVSVPITELHPKDLSIEHVSSQKIREDGRVAILLPHA